MQITLLIEGKEKTFSQTFIKAKLFRKVLEYRRDMNFEDLRVEDIDVLVELVVETYDHQFTVDEFYEGIEASELMSTITETFSNITSSSSKKTNVGNEKK